MNHHENFANWVLNATEPTPPNVQYPYVYEDIDGDRVEFFLSEEDCIADRIDGRLTVYRDRKEGNIVGGSIKGIKSLFERLCREFPGFAFNIREGKIDLKVVFSAVQLQEQDEVLSMHYRTLLEKLVLRGVTADMNVPGSIAEPDQAGCV